MSSELRLSDKCSLIAGSLEKTATFRDTIIIAFKNILDIMKEIIQSRITELTKKLDDCKNIIEICNQEIEQGILIPNKIQQTQIDAIAEFGRNTIDQIKLLNKLLDIN